MCFFNIPVSKEKALVMKVKQGDNCFYISLYDGVSCVFQKDISFEEFMYFLGFDVSDIRTNSLF